VFRGPVRVPADAGLGRAKVTVSFPGWKAARVEPVTAEVQVVAGAPKPR
jgi:hypothetical protein